MNGEAKFLRPLPDGVSQWLVYVAHRRVQVVWDEARQFVVTVYPEFKRQSRDRKAVG
jgi:hypothetical protein